MICPQCKLQLRINPTKTENVDGMHKQEFVCQNKKCFNYRKVVYTKDIPVEDSGTHTAEN